MTPHFPRCSAAPGHVAVSGVAGGVGGGGGGGLQKVKGLDHRGVFSVLNGIGSIQSRHRLVGWQRATAITHFR